MTVELKRDDISLLLSLLTRDMDRVGEVKEKYGFCDPSYFYRLVDMRNKLLAIPVAEELPAGFNDKEAVESNSAGIKRKSISLNGALTEQDGRVKTLNRR